ncbi:biotin synthase BioB [bacterium endosymbiont of Pedicinus badii]|uniref:biotin synthase BioB n=1 Tax=bacterium endosymbiont of Pedicinus badii TaxID=1719126 RepID=UPI0009BB5959|nr:biotin synthase BioB [bacterium endosymbiont of Pedicinus badii]OQM34333.1 biotin synthase [bacterium endosymbiont of Pedicinus badii]
MLKNEVWTVKRTKKLFKKPFFDLLFDAQMVHRKNFNVQNIQVSTLLSIKTGACPEDCQYCAQSARYKTKIKKENLLKIEKILQSAKKALQSGSTRFCMGAAWRNPKDRDIPYLVEVIKKVKKLGLETCMTLGFLKEKQAKKLAEAGLDFYNHNLDTSRRFYSKIISTRNYQERLDTLKVVRKSGIKVCSGGILGLGEEKIDRIELLVELANLKKSPESIPINVLVKNKGTPLYNKNIKELDPFDLIRTIAVARIMMPTSYVRLSAGRENMNEQTQALCFLAGANSIFYGCKLLTVSNVKVEKDIELFKKLDLKIEKKNLFYKEKEELNNSNFRITNRNDLYYEAK